MARLSKSAAARQLHISRTTLYKLIEQGALSATPDGMIDSTELVRVAPLVDSLKERIWTSMDSNPAQAWTSMNSAPHLQQLQADVQREQLVDSAATQAGTPVHERERTSTVQDLVDTVREQMQLMREELQAAREERARLLQMLQDMQQRYDEMQHRYDRLLDLPRTPSPASPQDAAGAPQTPRQPVSRPARSGTPQAPPAAQGGDPRGAMRRRIVALLQDYPDGLTPAEMRGLLGVDRSLADTCLGMLKYGLVQRVQRGRYVATAPPRTDHT